MSISIQSRELFALQEAVIANRKTAGQERAEDECVVLVQGTLPSDFDLKS